MRMYSKHEADALRSFGLADESEAYEKVKRVIESYDNAAQSDALTRLCCNFLSLYGDGPLSWELLGLLTDKLPNTQ